MTRKTIGGTLDHHAMALLHRPVDPDDLAREAHRLVAAGLTILDVAAALRLTPGSVSSLLARPVQPEGNPPCEPL